MKAINRLRKFLFGKQKKKGFTIAETIVAIAIITIITASALTVIERSSVVYRDSLARRDARILADNALNAFQSSTNRNGFENALSIASKSGFTPNEVNDELTYEASNVNYSYIMKDVNTKRVTIYDAANVAIASLDYSNATNWDNCTNHLLLSYSQAKISNLFFNVSLSSEAAVIGNGYLTASINMGESGNVILKLDTIAIVEKSKSTTLLKQEYYKITDTPENLQLYYSDAENCFYGAEKGAIYKYVYGSYPRSATGLVVSSTYPAFLKEATTYTDIPDSCKYTKETLGAAGTKAFNLIAAHIQDGNNTGSGTIAYEGDMQYVHPTATNFAAESLDKASLTENLVDNNNIAILTKNFKNESDFKNRVLELNESELVEDEGNAYSYNFDYVRTYTQMEYVDVIDYKDVTIKGTATIEKYKKSGTNYYKMIIPFKNGTTTEKTLTYDNKYKTVSALKTGSASMNDDIAELNSDYIQTSGNYVASLKLGNDRSNQNYTITASASDLYIIAQKSGSTTKYYYNPSTKAFTTTKKAFSSKEARSNVLKGFNTNSSYSYPTPSSTSTTFATFEYTKKVQSGSHKEKKEVEHKETLHLSTIASYSDKKIKTINTKDNEVFTEDDALIINKTYDNLGDFIAAQRALKNNRTFVPSGKYRYINETIFDAISVSRNVSGGSINFLDKKGSTIYSLPFYNNEDLNAALASIKSGSYSSRYKFTGKYYFKGEDNSDYSGDKNFNKNFTYKVNESTRTIFDETNNKYLKATKASFFSSITYSWQDNPFDLDDYYDEAIKKLKSGSSAIDHYTYTGSTNESITVKASPNTRTLIFFTNNVEIFSWQYKDDDSFNSAISSYKSSYESSGNGYVCFINGYTLTISISFTQNTFEAEVTDEDGKVIYELNYSKG